MNTTAYLSNDGEYTYFYIGDRVVTFLTRKSLEQYKKIVEWDNGYKKYLSGIERVELRYE